MAARKKKSFDPREFLAKSGIGRAVSKYRKHDILFSQGDAADAVFYVQKAR
jgi:CRP/FNR family transcriptional regulator, cyclic AMP receptor protein